MPERFVLAIFHSSENSRIFNASKFRLCQLTKPTSNATSSEQCGGLALLKVGLSCYKDMIGTHHNPNKDRLSQVCNLCKDPSYIYRNFYVILNETVLQVCSVLDKSHLGADHHFWVKTRFRILVESSFIWANQVWPRAILAPKNDKNKKCSD